MHERCTLKLIEVLLVPISGPTSSVSAGHVSDIRCTLWCTNAALKNINRTQALAHWRSGTFVCTDLSDMRLVTHGCKFIIAVSVPKLIVLFWMVKKILSIICWIDGRDCEQREAQHPNSNAPSARRNVRRRITMIYINVSYVHKRRCPRLLESLKSMKKAHEEFPTAQICVSGCLSDTL